MLKFLRLTINNHRRHFSLFQLNKLFKQAATNRIIQNTEAVITETERATMSTAETNGSRTENHTPQTQNLDGIVKFLELLGNLKVSKFIFCAIFIQ